jgi:hypothetical protein
LKEEDELYKLNENDEFWKKYRKNHIAEVLGKNLAMEAEKLEKE